MWILTQLSFNLLSATNISRIGWGVLESDFRYYQRRAASERQAAMRAVTPEARQRRMSLAVSYAVKAQECREVQLRFAI
jgi:hypothetical protein